MSSVLIAYLVVVVLVLVAVWAGYSAKKTNHKSKKHGHESKKHQSTKIYAMIGLVSALGAVSAGVWAYRLQKHQKAHAAVAEFSSRPAFLGQYPGSTK